MITGYNPKTKQANRKEFCLKCLAHRTLEWPVLGEEAAGGGMGKGRLLTAAQVYCQPGCNSLREGLWAELAGFRQTQPLGRGSRDLVTRKANNDASVVGQ